jgi:hypothetical protein
MKGLKIVAFVVAGIVVLLALGFMVALTPAVQTWAVRKAVAGQPGLTLQVGRVDAGFSAAHITDLNVVKDGMVITAKDVTAKYSAWDYISNKKINVEAVNVQDAVIDLRNAKPAAATAPNGGANAKAPAPKAGKSAKPAGEPFQGLLKSAQLPFDVRVAALSANGRALLPNEQSANFDVKVSNVQTGQRGKVEWTVDFADAKKDAPLRGIKSTGNAGIHLTAERQIDIVEVDATATATGPNLPPDRIRLNAKAEQVAGGNESYLAQVGLERGTTVEPLVKVNATYTAAKHDISGTWDLTVRTEQLAAVLAGLGLPEVAAHGAGKFSLQPDTNAVAASGNLEAQASQLQKLSPALEAVGTVQLKTEFDGSMADDIARLNTLNIEVTGADGRKFAQVSSLQKIAYGLADKRVTLADPKAELARITLQALPLAWAQPMAKPMVIESGDLSVVLAVEAEPDGSRVKARAVEPLVIRTVTVRDAAKKALVEKVTLSVRPSVDYSAAKVSAQLTELKISMPAGDNVGGTVTADVTNLSTTPAIAFTAQLQAHVVAALKPYLPVETGPLDATIAVEGRQEGQLLQLTKSITTVNREGGALLAKIEAQQPVRGDLKTASFTVPNPTATAVRVQLGEIPLSWGEAFVPKSKFGGALSGGVLDVSLRSVDDITLTTAQPLTLKAVSATMDGKAMAQGLDLSANLTATKKGEAVSYEVRRIEVKQGEVSLATLVVAGEAKLGAKMTVAAKGNLEADLAALMRQPMLADSATLSRGKLTAAFDANLADAIQAKATIAAKDLVAKQDNRPLGNLDVSLNANVKTDGSGTITMPVTLAGPSRKSDISVDGAFGKAAKTGTFLFTGKIASTQLFVEDFEPLAGLAPSDKKPAEAAKPTVIPATRAGQPTIVRAPTPAPGATPGAAPGAAPAAGRDTEPFWKAVNGKVEMDLKRIVYGKDYIISGVRGTAVITDTKLSLDGLEGKFKENPFKVSGGVTFAAQQPKPYTLIGSADVNNFDVGEFLRASNPNEKPALETKVTVSARLNGTGGNIGELGKNAFGKFDITGTKGTMYLLERKGAAGTLVNAASLGLAILGAARGSEGATAISEIAKLLASVPFDSLKMQVERGADLSFKMTSLEVLAPFMRVSGTGTVAAKSTDDIQNAPMNIVLQLGAKDHFAYLLQRVGMLGANRDEKGFQLMTRNFTVGGTPSKPDSSALWKILGEAAVGGLLR